MKLFNLFGLATFFSTFCLAVNVSPAYSENYVCLENNSAYKAKFYVTWVDTSAKSGGDGSNSQQDSVGPFNPGKTKCIKMYDNRAFYEGDTYRTWLKATQSYDPSSTVTIKGDEITDCGDWAVKTGSGESITWTATGVLTNPICTD